MPAVKFAVIGDYGVDTADELAVANLVKSQNPEFIVTVGDNTYGSRTPDTAIGKYYSDYIGNYKGSYGTGGETNRFFPALGNHDWSDGGGIQAYLDYFTLPVSSSGNERYYDFVQGPVHFFVLDSDQAEPDGRTAGSAQALWLEAGLKTSAAPWQIVVMHHPPYSSGWHGPEPTVRWSYEEWGADAVLSGHEHSYERLLKDDNGDGTVVPYFVNGIGGTELRSFSGTADPDSAIRYHAEHGSMLVKADDTSLTFELWSTTNGGLLIDTYTITGRAFQNGVSIIGTARNDVINATTSVAGHPLPTSGDDTISGAGGNDTLNSGGGNDALNGGTGNDRIHGESGNDRLYGNSGNDRIYAGIGDDSVNGGSGNDTLYGHSGSDTFVFNSKLGTAKTDRKINFDAIKDFTVKYDSFWLDNAVFKKLGMGTPSDPKLLNKEFFVTGSKARERDDYLIYNKGTGVLSYDADGAGSKEAVEFAQLSKNLKLTYKDFFVV